MADWPAFGDEDLTGRMGVHLVGLHIHKYFGWIFRETSSSDLGIDGEIELRQKDKTSHGRLISVQVKAGSSFLRERSATGYIYRGSYNHLRYWSAHTAPVMLILCNPDNGMCWWQDIDLHKVRFHDKGWSIEVPFEQELTAKSIEALEKVANRLQKKDLIELVLRDWLGWSFEHTIRFASTFAMPCDYHWLSLLGAVADEYFMIDYVLANVDGFDEAEVREMHHWADYNHQQYGYTRFLLAFIAESKHLLENIPDPATINGITVEYVPLLLDLREEPRLSEVGFDGITIAFYENGECLDDWARIVDRKIKRAEPTAD
jgi:hypothetical protein